MAGWFSQKHSHRVYGALLLVLTLWMTLPGIASVQVIDRDEARFAQATTQMVESGDYLNIKFQDKARNKKPAGIYWLQSVPVKIFTDPGENKIWAHRIISVLGAILAVFATYWGALAVLGRRGAFVAAGLLATTLVFTAEAHIAKTDAVLCGLSALCLASLLRLQRQPSQITGFIFWLALGAAIMIKGPITPAIIMLTLVSYGLWTREMSWLKSLINVPGIILALLMVVPWAIAIGIVTDGAFYKDSVVGDMGSKIAGGQEGHGLLPGYFTGTIGAAFWPGILLLVPGLAFARLVASKNSGDPELRRAVRLLICWIVPFWILLELTPTKLVHYPLPVYPALAILGSGAFFAMLNTNAFVRTRKVGAALFLIASVLIIAAVFGADAGLARKQSVFFYAFPLFVAMAFGATYCSWIGDVRRGAFLAFLLAVTFMPLTYQFILPNLTDSQVSRQISAALPDNKGARLLSPNFTEPSLVYEVRQDVLLGDKAEKIMDQGLKTGDIILIDQNEAEERHSVLNLNSKLIEPGTCLVEKNVVRGINYSKGDPVDIRIYRAEPCG